MVVYRKSSSERARLLRSDFQELRKRRNGPGSLPSTPESDTESDEEEERRLRYDDEE